MPAPEIEEFARLLMSHVRDEAISGCDVRLHPSARGATALRWRRARERLTLDDFVHEIIPDIVDEAIFYLLHAIDEDVLRLQYVAGDGKTVDLAEDGKSELAGWFAGYIWKKAYSKQRFNDDLSGLDDYTGPEAP